MPQLKAESLTLSCDPEQFNFKTTEEISETTEIIGQDRLSSAIEFGIGIQHEGYNIFALGPDKTDKQEHIKQFIESKAKDLPVPPDICYVNNFDEISKPKALTLPAGRGCKLRDRMNEILDDLIPTLTSAFETEEYQNRQQALKEDIQQEQDKTFEDIQKKAEENNLALVRTPSGFSIAPTHNGELIKQSELQDLPEEERDQIKENIQELQEQKCPFNSIF